MRKFLLSFAVVVLGHDATRPFQRGALVYYAF